MTDSPKIYVASLSDYNAGRLIGCWIDATQDPEDIQEDVNKMLAKSREDVAEEWAIHDYDGFGPMKLGEWESFETISTIAQMIEEHGESFAIFCYVSDREAWDEDSYLEAYQGEFSNFKEYAEEFAESCGTFDSIPENLQQYIDWDMWADELENDYNCETASNGNVYIYANY